MVAEGRHVGRAPSNFDKFILSDPWNQTARPGQRRTACWRCRKAKQKCNQEQPCSRCIDRGLSSSCSGSEQEPAAQSTGKVRRDEWSNALVASSSAVERPLKYRSRTIAILGSETVNFNRSRCGPRSTFDEFSMVMRFETGMNTSQTNSVGFRLNDSFMKKIMKGISAAKQISCNLQLCSADQFIQQGGTTAPEDRSLAAITSDIPADSSDCPWVCQTFDLASEEPCAFMMNSQFAQLCGLHTEEALTRLAHGELAFPATELEFLTRVLDIFALHMDTLCEVVAGTRSEMVTERTSYEVLTIANSDGTRSPLLVKQRCRMSDVSVTVTRVDLWFEPVTAEEWDKGVREGIGGTRRFLKAAGDTRSGVEVLETATADLEKSISAMYVDEKDRALLANLESTVEEAFDPCVEAAIKSFELLSLVQSQKESSDDSSSYTSSSAFSQPITPDDQVESPDELLGFISSETQTPQSPESEAFTVSDPFPDPELQPDDFLDPSGGLQEAESGVRIEAAGAPQNADFGLDDDGFHASLDETLDEMVGGVDPDWKLEEELEAFDGLAEEVSRSLR